MQWIMMSTLLSLEAPWVVIMTTLSLKTKDCQFDKFFITGDTIIMTTYGVTSDDKVVKLTIFCFQWYGAANDE